MIKFYKTPKGEMRLIFKFVGRVRELRKVLAAQRKLAGRVDKGEAEIIELKLG